METYGTKHEERSATPDLNEVQPWNRAYNVDNAGDHADNEWVLDARVLEIRSAIVEDLCSVRT